MKKLFITWGFVAAALTLFSCAKQETIVNDAQPAQAGVPFELVAGVDTKTEATDAGVVTWKTGDALNVFHAAAGTTEFPSTIKNDQFTFTTGSTFAGTLQEGELTADAYDWYALYPYYSGIKTPANTSKGYTTFRNAQTQVGNDSMAHLCGSNMPLYGKKTNVAKDTKPSIEMKQAASIIKVHVTNKLDAALTVASVSVTAPVNIAGNYFINFAGDTPSFTESSSSGKKNVTLTVSGGDPIAKDGSADFYIAVMPFSVSSGKITVNVNEDEKDITISSLTTFASGKIKTINFNYDHVDTLVEPTSETGWYRVEKADWLVAGDRVIIANHDGTKAMSKTYKANNRDGVAVTTAASGDYTVLTNNDNVQMFILEDGTASGSFAFWADNGDDASKYMYAASSSSNYLKFQETLDANASFVASLVNGLGNLTAQGSNSRKVVQWNNLFACYSGASYNSISLYKYYGAWAGSTTCANPSITQNGTTITITCATPGVKIYYTIDGSTPTTESTLYADPFVIASPVTVKAIAVRSHYTNSDVASKTCPVTVATPVITGLGTSFTITCATEGATIYYETSTVDLANVNTPTNSSSSYSAAVAITQTTYVKAIAVKDGYTNSEVASETCTYSGGGGGKTNQVLFHETFGNNTGSARAWDDSYSVKSGVSAVYSGITSYTVSNAKQGKNTTGSTQSGLNQTSAGTDAYIIIGPLDVSSAENMVLTYQWKAASVKGTYSTSLYYSTSSGGSYTEVSGTGAGATTFVERTYNLPVAAQVNTLYLKIVWNTSNTQGIIDEVNLQGDF